MNSVIFEKPYFYNRRNRLISLGLLVVLGVCVQFFAAYALSFILDMMPNVKEAYAELVDSLVYYDSKAIIWVAIVAPVFEECFFRLVVMYLGQKFMPFWIVNIIQAVIFGLYHGNWVQGIYAFILGMLLGFIRHDSGTIFASIILHMSINTAGIICELYPLFNGEDMEKLLLLTVTVLTGAGVVIVKYLHTMWNKQE